YAVNKFYSCYPVWSDDDGGWHEGVSYWSGYQNKVVWWLQVAQSALAIDGLKKPFFAQVGDYPLYICPPHSPNAGFGDLSARPVSAPAFMEYHLRARSVSGDGGNAAHWAWWAKAKEMPANPGVLGFLYRANLPPLPKAQPPTDMPQSKIFHGIGIASLHTTLVDSRDDVHFLMKASPMGSQSHGHNPQNSFQLNAYGEALLVANGYRDLHGSKFHYQFVHSTRAQNAVLVDGQGQIPHSRDATGKIVREELTAQYDYIVGDATPAYGKRLVRALRHAVLVKGATPFVVLYDDLAAPQPATFQFMLHGLAAFNVDEGASRLTIAQPAAAAGIAYLSPVPLGFKQTDGFEPKPTREFPNHWHVEAGTREKRKELGVVTVMLPYRAGKAPTWTATRQDVSDGVVVNVTIDGRTQSVRFPKGAAPVQVKLAAN
ncbi:MAG TPA: heparinase II/III family protein, partial [Opitutaceae bacterium]